MNIIAYTLVQLAATLLSLVEQSGTAAVRQQTVELANQSVRTALWAVHQNTPVDIDANIEKLQKASYLTESGVRIPLGTPDPKTGAKFELVDEYVSFGDLDTDNMHDAMPLLRTVFPDGKKEYHLAAMRNYGGILVNTVNQKINEPAAVYSHNIADKGLYLEHQPIGGTRTTTHYVLHPNYTTPQPKMIIVRNPDQNASIRAGESSKIASFLIFASPQADIDIRSLVLDKDFNSDVKLSNLRLVGNRGLLGSERAVVLDAESEIPFLVDLKIKAGGVEVVDVYADVVKSSKGIYQSMIDLVSGNAMGVEWPAPISGQDVTSE